MTKSNNKGFSLVELIVVIAIMAVLIGVLAPALIGNIEKSRESTDISNLDTVLTAVNTALADEAGLKDGNANWSGVHALAEVFDTTDTNHGGKFASAVREYCNDAAPTLSASRNEGAFIYFQIVTPTVGTGDDATATTGKQVTVFASTTANIETAITDATNVTECDKLTYSNNDPKHFWVGYLEKNATAAAEGETTN